jgi:IMP dehydrogenase/GMP reductase
MTDDSVFDFKAMVAAPDFPFRDYKDGKSAEEIFSSPHSTPGHTFDDVILLPGHIDFGGEQVDLTSRLTKNIALNMPFASSPMDTVTEDQMAIALALEGGIGIIHGNCTIEHQAACVSKVKRYENGFIKDPVCLKMDMPISSYDALAYNGIPVTDTGKAGGKLLGFVDAKDADFQDDRSTLIKDVMTPREQLIVATAGLSLQQANDMVRDQKVNNLPIVNQNDELVALVTRMDMLKNKEFPNALKETTGDNTPRHRYRSMAAFAAAGSPVSAPQLSSSPPSPLKLSPTGEPTRLAHYPLRKPKPFAPAPTTHSPLLHHLSLPSSVALVPKIALRTCRASASWSVQQFDVRQMVKKTTQKRDWRHYRWQGWM